MDENKLYGTFEQDTKNFINQINESLIKLENDGYSVDEINHIFRCIHSIKSEAAYLNLGEITKAAHDMESAIEPLRNVGQEVEVDPVLVEFCFATIDKIGALAIETLITDEEEVTELVEIFEADDEDIKELPMNLPYSEFELMLLREAMARGEKLFRLEFGIADDEAMKFPRAYLAVSNLEQTVNVIKAEPSPEQIDDSADKMMKIILTADKSGSEIIEEVNIDQLVDVKIYELVFHDELENIPDSEIIEVNEEELIDEKILSSRDRVISVEAEEIEAISDYVSEIKKRLSDLSTAVVGGSTDSNLEYDLAGLESISDSIGNMMSNLKTVDFNTHFAGFKRTVSDIADELSKKAELKFDSGNIRVQRDFAEFISEPLLQIIRNSVVHGIESPAERGAKDEIGSITVKTSLENGNFSLIISDDGSGIDISAIPGEYGNITTDDQLLELLTQPGYTTLAESKQFGGRGVGLDLVVNRIKTRGGRLELKNTKGAGCEFRIVFDSYQL
ncbi:MAG TPA: hypothetical protein DCO79_02960 [Spirochaeta sp.]|nr:hypothetical protein [Spirochaeta sp.]